MIAPPLVRLPVPLSRVWPRSNGAIILSMEPPWLLSSKPLANQFAQSLQSPPWLLLSWTYSVLSVIAEQATFVLVVDAVGSDVQRLSGTQVPPRLFRVCVAVAVVMRLATVPVLVM